MSDNLQQALARLKRDPKRPVRARIDDLMVELRAVEDATTSDHSAADAFAEIGPWEGETTQEAIDLLKAARQQGGSRQVPDL